MNHRAKQDAQTVMEVLGQSASGGEAMAGIASDPVPHLDWVLITAAVEGLPGADAGPSAQSSTPSWPLSSLLTSTGLSELKWPPPERVAASASEHMVSIVTGELDGTLVTSWGFEYPDGFQHTITSVPIPMQDLSEPGHRVEEFARSIARKVGWDLGPDDGGMSDPNAVPYRSTIATPVPTARSSRR